MDSILQLLHKLQLEQVEFVLIGGLAAVFHGSAIVTQDIDICLQFTPANTPKLIKALQDFDPCFRMSPMRKELPLDEVELQRFKNLYLNTTAGQLDILSEVDGIGDYDEVKRHSQEMQYEGMPLRLLSLDATLQSKMYLKRDKDRRSIVELQRIKQERSQKTP